VLQDTISMTQKMTLKQGINQCKRNKTMKYHVRIYFLLPKETKQRKIMFIYIYYCYPNAMAIRTDSQIFTHIIMISCFFEERECWRHRVACICIIRCCFRCAKKTGYIFHITKIKHWSSSTCIFERQVFCRTFLSPSFGIKSHLINGMGINHVYLMKGRL
jgi:hypothetical protein